MPLLSPQRIALTGVDERQAAHPTQPDGQASGLIQAIQNPVEGGARAHGRLHLRRIGVIIPAKIHRLALCGTDLLQNHVNVGLQGLRNRSKTPFQLLIVILRRQLLGSIQRFVDMAAGIVQLAEHATWSLAVLHQLAGGAIQRISEYLRFLIACEAAQMGEGFGQGHKFPQ